MGVPRSDDVSVLELAVFLDRVACGISCRNAGRSEEQHRRRGKVLAVSGSTALQEILNGRLSPLDAALVNGIAEFVPEVARDGFHHVVPRPAFAAECFPEGRDGARFGERNFEILLARWRHQRYAGTIVRRVAHERRRLLYPYGAEPILSERFDRQVAEQAGTGR